jgi:hypothetical protein
MITIVRFIEIFTQKIDLFKLAFAKKMLKSKGCSSYNKIFQKSINRAITTENTISYN